MINEYVVYVGHDNRIVHAAHNTSIYVPIVYEKILYYYMDSLPPTMDIYDYSVIKKDGKNTYMKRLDITDHILKVTESQRNIIRILEDMNDFSRFYMRAYETNYVSRYMNFFLYEEIDEYKKTGVVGPILTSLKDIDDSYSIDDVVDRESMKRQDVKNMLSYLNSVEAKVRKLIKKEKYDEASFFITKERGKTRW